MSKLPNFGVSIFSVMSQLACEHDAINLSQGFPDYCPDSHLVTLLAESALNGSHQYAPMAGLMALREQIASKFLIQHSVAIDPNGEITIIAGATQGIYTSIAAIVGAGDEVILLDPSYDSYAPSVLAQGGIPVRIPHSAPDFTIDWDRVNGVVSPRTRMIIVNNPNNPTGKVFSADDLNALASIAEAHNLIVLSDEVYEGIVFDGSSHLSVLSHPGLKTRCLAVYSFGKSFHITGWKIGYCIASAHLMRLFRNLHQFLVFSVNTSAQLALSKYMTRAGSTENLGNYFQQRRDFLIDGLLKCGFKLRASEGTYFQLADYSNIQPDMDEHTFARWLTVEHRVACIPLMPFYEHNLNQRLVRFCFGKKQSTLDAALVRLRQLSNSLN